MVSIKGEIPPKIEEEFRKLIALKYGMKKGNISIALQNAIEEWILKQKRELFKDKMTNELILKDIRKRYPNQFTAIDKEGKIITHGNSITDIFEKLDPETSARIIEPINSRLHRIHKKRQLSWHLQRKPREPRK